MSQATITLTWTYGISWNGYRLVLQEEWGYQPTWRMRRDYGSLETILGEIERALKYRLYYSAVAVALTVPEICGSIESPNGWGGQHKYIDWFDRYLAPRFTHLTAQAMHQLRSGVVHQGRYGREKDVYQRVLFTLPGPITAHDNYFGRGENERALNLDPAIFCQKVIEACKAWYDEKRDDPHVVANIGNVVHVRPNGLSPYIVGVPLIA